MLEHYLRPLYQRIFVTPVAGKLAPYLTPNAITLASLAIGAIAALAVAFNSPILACALLLFSGYMDTLDGSIARLTGKTSNFGAMLDILCDRGVEWAMIMGLYAVNPATRGWLCLLMLGSILVVITGFLTAGIFLPNDSEKSFNYTPGLMERAEAFSFFIAMMFFPQFFKPLAVIFSVLVLYTAWLRIAQTYKFMQQK